MCDLLNEKLKKLPFHPKICHNVPTLCFYWSNLGIGHLDILYLLWCAKEIILGHPVLHMVC